MAFLSKYIYYVYGDGVWYSIFSLHSHIHNHFPRQFKNHFSVSFSFISFLILSSFFFSFMKSWVSSIHRKRVDCGVWYRIWFAIACHRNDDDHRCCIVCSRTVYNQIDGTSAQRSVLLIFIKTKIDFQRSLRCCRRRRRHRPRRRSYYHCVFFCSSSFHMRARV